jgi:hypothetical protein
MLGQEKESITDPETPKMAPTEQCLCTQDSYTSAAEMILEIAQGHPKNAELHIKTNIHAIVKALTVERQWWEERGWIGAPTSELLRSTTANLRARTAKTTIQFLDKNDPNMKEAHTLAALGAEKPRERLDLDLDAPDHFLLHGAQLSCMTQKLLYQGIIRSRTKTDRAATEVRLGTTRACIEELNENQPSDKEIWDSLTRKTFPNQIRNFIWKNLHNAYKCGKYWRNIPNYELRGECQACNTEENMDHILTECITSKQQIVWAMAEELMQLRGISCMKPRFGAILGSGLVEYKSPEGRKLTGASRLCAIVVSESAHLIWKMRPR